MSAAAGISSSADIGYSRSDFYTSLKLKKRIDALFKTGSKAFSRNLMLRFHRNPEIEQPLQVVFAVSARLGDAHVRNRIKRRLREALFATLKKGAVKKKGFDLAVLPKKETADLPFEELCAELEMALRRLK